MGRPKLSEVKRAQILDILSRGESQAQAAKTVGCSPETVRNMMFDEDFRAQVQKGQEEFIDGWRSRLPSLVPKTFEAAAEILQSGNAAAKVKIISLVWATMKISDVTEVQKNIEATVELGDHPPVAPDPVPVKPVPEPVPEDDVPDPSEVLGIR
jgi:hypothetical protein